MSAAEPVGLAHDYLLVLRGAERTFAAIADEWPGAPIYTTVYDERALGARLAGHEIRPSYLQRLPIRQRGFRRLAPLYPRAVERLPVGGHDVVVSSSSAYMIGLRPGRAAVHVCYCHTPFRYAWFERERALAELPRPLRPLASRAIARQRRWDIEASRRVTRFIANGRLTQQRIADIYGREAAIVHPPVEISRFTPGEPEDFLLIVCELVGHKRVDVALEAARIAGLPVAVVGTGPAADELRSAFPQVRFHGRVDDETLAGLYRRCLALLVPNVEEFGIAAVEAQASGRPVVGRAAGGTAETIVPGETGVLFERDDAAELAAVLRETDFRAFDPAAARASAERFSPARFRAGIRAEVRAAARSAGLSHDP